MDVLGIGGPEIFVIMIFAIVVLGPQRLANVARKAGQLVRELKAYFATFSDELKGELDILDEINSVKKELPKF